MERTLSQAREVLAMRQLITIQETADLRQKTEDLSARTRALEQQLNQDILTGVSNRRFLEHLLEEEFAAANTNSWPLAIAFVDIDNFKRINDNYGHPDGDIVLRAIAQLLQQSCRLGDSIGRYGGDEFLLVFPGTDLSGASVVCNRALEACRSMRYRLSGGQSIEVTLSIGIAVYGDTESFNDLKSMLRSADKALYEAKARGRDRSVAHREE
jgi:diguanylate cyclase (GGDEF)-like protein